MREIWREENLIQKWLDIELALVKALSEQGVIPPDAAEDIARMSHVSKIDIESILDETKDTRHLIAGLVRAFRKKCGSAAEYYHLGSTTQDILDTGLTLMIKESYKIVLQEMIELQDIMIALAKNYKKTVMAGRSQGQQGSPITFGFKVAIWASEIQDHIERLCEVQHRVFLVNISGAMGTKASFYMLLGPVGAEKIQQRVGEIVGLSCPVINMHHRTDRFAEVLNHLALLCSSLGEIGLELRDLQRTEVGEIAEIWDSKMEGSSTMPHKRNPEPSHWLEGLAKIARANALAMMDMQMQHERDATRTAVEFACIPQSFNITSASLETTKQILSKLYVDEERMRENLNLQKGLGMSEAVVIKIFQKTGRKLEAHQVVKECTVLSLQKKLPFSEALHAHPKIKEYLTEHEIKEILAPENYCGTAPQQVEVVCKQIESKREVILSKLREL